VRGRKRAVQTAPSRLLFSPSILAFYPRLLATSLPADHPTAGRWNHRCASHSLGAQTHSTILICNIGPDSSRRPTQLLCKGVLSLLLTLRKASGTDRTREISMTLRQRANDPRPNLMQSSTRANHHGRHIGGPNRFAESFFWPASPGAGSVPRTAVYIS
jgi:hypothetical protein